MTCLSTIYYMKIKSVNIRSQCASNFIYPFTFQLLFLVKQFFINLILAISFAWGSDNWCRWWCFIYIIFFSLYSSSWCFTQRLWWLLVIIIIANYLNHAYLFTTCGCCCCCCWLFLFLPPNRLLSKPFFFSGYTQLYIWSIKHASSCIYLFYITSWSFMATVKVGLRISATSLIHKNLIPRVTAQWCYLIARREPI